MFGCDISTFLERGSVGLLDTIACVSGTISYIHKKGRKVRSNVLYVQRLLTYVVYYLNSSTYERRWHFEYVVRTCVRTNNNKKF